MFGIKKVLTKLQIACMQVLYRWTKRCAKLIDINNIFQPPKILNLIIRRSAEQAEMGKYLPLRLVMLNISKLIFFCKLYCPSRLPSACYVFYETADFSLSRWMKYFHFLTICRTSFALVLPSCQEVASNLEYIWLVTRLSTTFFLAIWKHKAEGILSKQTL